ncbi:thioredoxin domain-containing protein [Thermoleophilia bacterium SCSIO 60948]|nr:thioredoxin domain-containing protein [Thermoleophilia bacterium SCSIO 60948]
MAEQAPRAVFCFDLASPYSYLAAERISGVFAEAGAEQPEWRPVLAGALFARFDRTSWGLTDEREAGIAECERRASAYGLPPFRWPDPWPGDSLRAMRAATFAKGIGRSTSFTLAAFRQAFAAGRDLTELDNVLIAAAAAEMHPRAVTQAVERQAIKDELRAATDDAGDRGVFGVPSVIVGDEVFWGDDRLEEAAESATR